jgi:SAM-dependent methyltransferase
MEYERTFETAPPGWRHFTIADVDRLPASVRNHELARIPNKELDLLAVRDAAAGDRILRALFWTLVYHLEPERWDALATAEPIHPGVLAALPIARGRGLEIGAGSGRLTSHLALRCTSLVAIEPSAGLGSLLRSRLPGIDVVAAWAEALPLPDGWSSLTAACGLVGPDAAVLGELERVTEIGGEIVLISPEQPDWFEGHGWRRMRFDALPAPAHDDWIEGFFGPIDPPHDIVSRTIT